MEINRKRWREAEHILGARQEELMYQRDCVAAGICPACGAQWDPVYNPSSRTQASSSETMRYIPICGACGWTYAN